MKDRIKSSNFRYKEVGLPCLKKLARGALYVGRTKTRQAKSCEL